MFYIIKRANKEGYWKLSQNKEWQQNIWRGKSNNQGEITADVRWSAPLTQVPICPEWLAGWNISTALQLFVKKAQGSEVTTIYYWIKRKPSVFSDASRKSAPHSHTNPPCLDWGVLRWKSPRATNSPGREELRVLAFHCHEKTFCPIVSEKDAIDKFPHWLLPVLLLTWVNPDVRHRSVKSESFGTKHLRPAAKMNVHNVVLHQTNVYVNSEQWTHSVSKLYVSILESISAFSLLPLSHGTFHWPLWPPDRQAWEGHLRSSPSSCQ